MRIFKSRWFQRFARKEGITAAVLRETAHRAGKGQIDADELKQFREAAKHVLAISEKQLAELLKRGEFREVNENGQEIPK